MIIGEDVTTATVISAEAALSQYGDTVVVTIYIQDDRDSFRKELERIYGVDPEIASALVSRLNTP